MCLDMILPNNYAIVTKITAETTTRKTEEHIKQCSCFATECIHEGYDTRGE